MKGLVVLLLVSLLAVNGQVNSDCPRRTSSPPDFGDWGSCGQTIPNGETCSINCDNLGPQVVWHVAGAPRLCVDGTLLGEPQSCQFANYVSGKKNCTVTGVTSTTACSSMCAGTYVESRSVIEYAEVGGQPCPRLSRTLPCTWPHSDVCYDVMDYRGYYQWGPFCADTTERTISYRIYTRHNNIDLYVFDRPAFQRYTWDAALTKPQNAYYAPVRAHLNTYFEIDSFTVPPGKCYHLVLDNTNVGPTNGNNGVFDQFTFEFTLQGTNSNDGFSDFSYFKGSFQPAAAVRTSSISFFGAFLTAIIVFILKLE